MKKIIFVSIVLFLVASLFVPSYIAFQFNSAFVIPSVGAFNNIKQEVDFIDSKLSTYASAEEIPKIESLFVGVDRIDYKILYEKDGTLRKEVETYLKSVGSKGIDMEELKRLIEQGPDSEKLKVDDAMESIPSSSSKQEGIVARDDYFEIPLEELLKK